MELKPGELVSFRGIWHGVILDAFTSSYTNKTILHILFVKNIYKRQHYDVIEYESGAIVPTTIEKIKEQIDYYESIKTKQLDVLGLSLVDKGELC